MKSIHAFLITIIFVQMMSLDFIMGGKASPDGRINAALACVFSICAIFLMIKESKNERESQMRFQ